MIRLSNLNKVLRDISFYTALVILAITFFTSVSIVSTKAATFNVDSTIDAVDANPGDGICDTGKGFCSLRAAVMESNALLGPDDIVLESDSYAITIAGGDDAAANGDLDITDDVLIQGQGAMDTTIDGNNINRVFHIININQEGQIEVEIFDLKIFNGEVNDLGGGIRNSSGNLLLERVLIEANNSRRGGGLANGSQATTNIRSSAIYENNVLAGPEQWGGGIYNSGELEMVNTTISNNNVGDLGGGIFNEGNLNIIFSTIASNVSVSESSAGIHQTISGSTTIYASILANNFSFDCGGTLLTSQGFNISTSNCNLNQPSDMPNTNPVIDFLQETSGDTMAHPLLNESPAIDLAGSEEACLDLGVDQRGSLRPRDGDLDKDAECDSGAFELNPEIDSGESAGEGCSLVSMNSVTTLPLYMLVPVLVVLAFGYRRNKISAN
ncbi:MAG: choice-of-anchor Q domain-containing protein [Thermodesulfobacteriota bacterium]